MYGIENRCPFLDHRLVPYVFSDFSRKICGGWNKHELRQAFDYFVRLPTQWRKTKQGFKWNGKAFLRKNRQSILELLAGSRCLSEHYNMQKYVERAQNDDRYYFNHLTERLCCVAGLEDRLNFSLD